ncbi:hypothetical protein [Parageobacillus genomosp. 1]|nr:hypothetical protein [Parageobacillus genomosp. 1]
MNPLRVVPTHPTSLNKLAEEGTTTNDECLDFLYEPLAQQVEQRA